MEKNSKIYVAGHCGMVGSAIVRELKRQGYENILTRTHAELDLTRQADVEKFFATEKPEYVFLAAAKVGGIVANNSAPADFMYGKVGRAMKILLTGATSFTARIYGRWDKFFGERAHMIPAVIQRLSQAVADGKGEVEIWGDGTARKRISPRTRAKPLEVSARLRALVPTLRTR